MKGQEEFFAQMIQGISASLPPSRFSKIKIRKTAIPTPDRIALQTFVYMPDTDGSWPVILIRNPYSGNDLLAQNLLGPIFAKYGYAVVYNQVRGSLGSEGEWLPFEHEKEDGRAVIDWIAQQEWCDGNIGCFGASYLGLVQWSIADYHHPMLKTLFVSVMGAHPYPLFYRRGMFRTEIWTEWALQMMEDNRFKLMMPGDNLEEKRQAFALQPQTDLGQRLKGKACSWYHDWITNESESSPYWTKGFWKAYEDGINDIQIPVFLHGGWFDIFLRSQLDTYRRLPETVRDQSRFVIGPWTHAGIPGGPLSYPHENFLGPMQLNAALEWFDFRLKGMAYPHPLGLIEAYRIGENQWKVWKGDFSAAETKTLYFDCQTPTDSALTEKCPVQDRSLSYLYDPSDPVESRGGTLIANNRDPLSQPECSTDQPKIGERKDVLSFVSGILDKPHSISGAMEAHLFVASSAKATAFTIKVIEEFPDGRSLNIRDDISDIRWIDENSAKPYQEGQVVELNLILLDIQWTLTAGSKLRIDISSSNFPAYHIHPNLPETWSTISERQVATQTFFSGKTHPSKILLPLSE